MTFFPHEQPAGPETLPSVDLHTVDANRARVYHSYERFLRDWLDQLDLLCAMTPGFGKMTNDGLGRAIASCGPVAGARP